MSRKETSFEVLEKVFISESYCLNCKQWTGYIGSHKCPTKHTIWIDGALRGIVDRLYHPGIVPESASFDLNCFDRQSKMYCIKLNIHLKQHLNCAVLGDLPAGWNYYWDHDEDKICMLGYMDYKCYVGVMKAKERVYTVANEFEKFLDKRDREAVKAMLLLTGG